MPRFRKWDRKEVPQRGQERALLHLIHLMETQIKGEAFHLLNALKKKSVVQRVKHLTTISICFKITKKIRILYPIT